MLRKTVEIATPGTRLSISLKQLVIERPGEDVARLPVEDIGVLVIDDNRAVHTQAVFRELVQAGATVMVSGWNHLPLGMMLPLDHHHIVAERHRAQTEASLPLKKRLWRALVTAKLDQQGRALRAFGPDDAGLSGMARKVRAGDPDNLEAQGAQRYWPRLFGREFRRDHDRDDANALLNYGYAILRAACARALVASGLIPTLGVFHRNRTNPFCLADDLLEPFRPIVDWRVRLLAGQACPSLENRQIRATLLSLFNETIMCGGRRVPLLVGIEAASASLGRALTGGDETLSLPGSMPLGQHSREHARRSGRGKASGAGDSGRDGSCPGLFPKPEGAPAAAGVPVRRLAGDSPLAPDRARTVRTAGGSDPEA